jgi:hypothetical protein
MNDPNESSNLNGWGLAAAIAFAPLELWWEALRLAYGLACQTSEDRAIMPATHWLKLI